MTVLDRDEELLSVGDKQFFFVVEKYSYYIKSPLGRRRTVRQENMAAEATALRREPSLPDSFLVHGKFVIRESQQVKSSMKCSVAL